MKPFKILFVFAFVLLHANGKAQKSTSRIEIVKPTIQQEATSIWRTINDISFLEKQGYTINLPKDALIDSLILKSKKGTFGNEDFRAIYELVESKVFNEANYKEAIQKVEDQIDLINRLILTIDTAKSTWDWNFKMFDQYKVIFTLYGTGGSYDPDRGTITLLTNKKGGFMNYKNPANTIIHEIVHMGMEYSIVRKYKLPHGLKERIVDTFVYLMFHKKLPEYRIQNMGDVSIDKHVNKQKDIASLNAIISKFVKK